MSGQESFVRDDHDEETTVRGARWQEAVRSVGAVDGEPEGPVARPPCRPPVARFLFLTGDRVAMGLPASYRPATVPPRGSRWTGVGKSVATWPGVAVLRAAWVWRRSRRLAIVI